MKKAEKVNFGNPVIKQGNSFSVRIPKMAVDALQLNQGERVKVSITRPKPSSLSNEQITNLIKEYREIKDFDKFGDEKLMTFLLITHKIINEKLAKEKDMREDEKKLLQQLGDKLIDDYKFSMEIWKKNAKEDEKKLLQQFGGNFVKDYKSFMKILEKNPSAFSILKKFH